MSQWKSQFDDSEETDNEWKGENLQSPEHRLSLHGISLASIFIFIIIFNLFLFLSLLMFCYICIYTEWER